MRENKDDYEDTTADEKEENEEEHEKKLERMNDKAKKDPDSKFKPVMIRNSLCPPQISTETVVAVATPGSEHSFRSSSTSSSPTKNSKQAEEEVIKSKFLDSSPMLVPNNPIKHRSSWIHHEANETPPAHYREAQDTTTRTQQRLWLLRESIDHPPSENSILYTVEQRREFERVTKEFLTLRKFVNPLTESVERLRTVRVSNNNATVGTIPLVNPKQRRSSAGSPPEAELENSFKRVSSLSAITLNNLVQQQQQHEQHQQHKSQQLQLIQQQQQSSPASSPPNNTTWHSRDVTESTAGSAAAEIRSATYLLHRLWKEGWSDPERQQPNGEAAAANGISSQAQQVQQRLWHRDRTTTK